jgi:hypothetical protein
MPVSRAGSGYQREEGHHCNALQAGSANGQQGNRVSFTPEGSGCECVKGCQNNALHVHLLLAHGADANAQAVFVAMHLGSLRSFSTNASGNEQALGIHLVRDTILETVVLLLLSAGHYNIKLSVLIFQLKISSIKAQSSSLSVHSSRASTTTYTRRRPRRMSPSVVIRVDAVSCHLPSWFEV